MRKFSKSRSLVPFKTAAHVFIFAVAFSFGLSQFSAPAFAQQNNGNGNSNPGGGNGNGNGNGIGNGNRGGGNNGAGNGANDPNFEQRLGWYKKKGSDFFPGNGNGNPWLDGGFDGGGNNPVTPPPGGGTVTPPGGGTVTPPPGTQPPGNDGNVIGDNPPSPIDGNFGTPPSDVELAASQLVRQVACLVEEDKDGKKFCREAETRKYRRKLITVNFGAKSSAE